MGLYGTGDPPAEHPAGGDVADIVPVDLDEELVRLAFLGAADVQIVKTASPDRAAETDTIPADSATASRSDPAIALDKLGGVGALLRYSIF
jgi:hypothetical protein